MKEEERAHRLAEAIDRLLRGEEPQLADEELAELLRIAKLRRAAAQEANSLSEKYRDFVWARIEERIRQLLERRGITNSLATKEPGAGSQDPEEGDCHELAEVIKARRQLSQGIARAAEAYRDLVWQRVQARIKAGQGQARRFALRRKEQNEAERLGQAIEQLILGEPIWEAADSSLKDLVRLARLRHVMSKALAASGASHQGRLWARLRARLMAQARSSWPAAQDGMPIPTKRAVWPKLAAVTLGLALLVFALGLLPATGFAHHPISQFVSLLRHLAGITETSAPPAVPWSSETQEGIDVTTGQAQALMGLPLRTPSYLPQGFEQVASQYFSRGITAAEGGLFQLVYERANADVNPATIIIWQEQASPDTVAVQSGFAQPLTLNNGLEATYFEGMWRVQGTEIVWGDDGAQTILFDQGPLRTIILYLDSDKLDRQALLAIANSMVGA